MSKPVWTTPKGFIGTVTENVVTSTTVYANNTATYELISGTLPVGLKFKTENDNGVIYGTPESVGEVQSFQFVVRAKNNYGISDRTFNIDVSGPTNPEWITPEGYLPIGTYGQYYVINKQNVDFKLQASFDKLPIGQKGLRYYIAENDGTLPPGLTLHDDGRIDGRTNDILGLDSYLNPSGGYDVERYDAYPYDHSVIINDEELLVKLNVVAKTYQFYVTVSDGITTSRRLFKIRVEDPINFKIDNALLESDTTLYTADTDYLLAGQWLTSTNLGVIRANNNQVISIDTFDPYKIQGPTTFNWYLPTVNTDGTLPVHPPNFNLDMATGVLYGLLPYQTAYSLTYKFTVRMIKTDAKTLNFLSIIPASINTSTNIITLNSHLLSTGTDVIYRSNGGGVLRPLLNERTYYVGAVTTDTFKLYNSTLDSFNETNEINFITQGNISQTLQDSSNARKVYSDKTFVLTVKGEVENSINFITDSDLGKIQPGEQSELFVKAVHSIDPLGIEYKLVRGVNSVTALTTGTNYPNGTYVLTIDPPDIPGGLQAAASVTFDKGSVKKVFVTTTGTGYSYIPNVMLTSIYPNNNGSTATFISSLSGDLPENLSMGIDGSIIGRVKHTATTGTYNFTVQASDIYLQSSVTKDFTLTVTEAQEKEFTRIFAAPLLHKNQRKYFEEFIEDNYVFDRSLLYRIEDPDFGLQRNIKLFIEHGYQKIKLNDFYDGMREFFYNKKFYFGDVKIAKANDNKGKYIYDIVYVEIIDVYKNNQSASLEGSKNVGDLTVFPNSAVNIQQSLESIKIEGITVETDEYQRPRFMRTIQSSSITPLGFILAVPLCYAIPGSGDTIVKRINIRNFDFKLLDFEIDRLIVEGNLSSTGAKYLLFPKKNITGKNLAEYTSYILGPDFIPGADGEKLETEELDPIFSEHMWRYNANNQ